MQLPSLIGTTRLALGTVQFGLPYGVANIKGQIDPEHGEAMLTAARDSGIDTLDTAISYGNSEVILGSVGVSDFRLISKLPKLHEPLGPVDDWVVGQVEDSLKRLRVSHLDGLLLHAPDDLIGPHGPAIAHGLQRARDLGLANRIGLSVYSPEQLENLIDRLPLEIVQIPANIFDRRFSETGWLDRLAKDGVEVHARSVFLQGLLLMPSALIPDKFAPYLTQIKRWHDWLEVEAAGKSPVQACLAHVASYAGINRIVVGADSLGQLQAIIEATSTSPLQAPESLASNSSPLINPTKWNKL